MFSPANLVRNRIFWLLVVFAVCLAGFPRGYAMTVLAAGGLTAGAGGLMLADGGMLGGDYKTFWVAGQMALSGEAAQLFDPIAFNAAISSTFDVPSTGFRWLYPPHWLVLITPFAMLPYFVSWLAFSLSTLALFLAACRQVIRNDIGQSTGLGMSNRLIIWLLLASPAMLVNFLFGQNGFLTSALLVGAFALFGRQPVRSGGLLGLLTIKPQFGLAVPAALLAGRQWRTIASALAAFAALAGLSVLLFGLHPWSAWFSGLAGSQGEMLSTRDQTFLDLQLSGHASARVLGAGPGLAASVQSVFVVIAMAGAAFAARTRGPADLKACLIITCSYLASPYLMIYDLPALSFVCLWLYLRLYLRLHIRRGKAIADPVTDILALTILALPFLNIVLVTGGMPLAPLLILGLAACLFRQLRRYAAGSAEPSDPIDPASASLAVSSSSVSATSG